MDALQDVNKSLGLDPEKIASRLRAAVRSHKRKRASDDLQHIDENIHGLPHDSQLNGHELQDPTPSAVANPSLAAITKANVEQTVIELHGHWKVAEDKALIELAATRERRDQASEEITTIRQAINNGDFTEDHIYDNLGENVLDGWAGLLLKFIAKKPDMILNATVESEAELQMQVEKAEDELCKLQANSKEMEGLCQSMWKTVSKSMPDFPENWDDIEG